MIKVVIVEDKPPILWSIKQKIENYSKEMSVVGEAYNGQEALSLINELKPDIVFTDIRMPVVDGLELISEVKKTFSDIHFIIISGFDEFEYARQAMRLGVSEYILKPVTQETINDILNKVVIDIKSKVSDYERKLIKGVLDSGNKINFVDCHFDCQYFITALMCAGSYSNQIIDYTNPFNFFGSKINIDELVSGLLPENTFLWCFDGKSLNEMILILGLSENSYMQVKQYITSISSALLALNIPVTIAVSQIINNINDIGIEAKNTRVLLRKTLTFGKPSIIFSDTPILNISEKSHAIDSFIEKRLLSFIQNKQKNLFFNEIKKIMDYFSQNDYTQYNIENSLRYIAHICNKSPFAKADYSNSPELEIEEVLSISNDYSALLQGLISIFSHFFPDTNDLKQKREPLKEIINNVEKYIHANFSKQITINDIADMVKVDPCHLSKTFKSMKGVSPMESLTKLRIEKSKELILSSSSLMLKDIAEIVGYSNQYYFSRIFKLVTGLTPSEYKNSIQT
jgi:two-component system, response regulator YesN